MAVRFRRPPAREWVPMVVGTLLAAAGALTIAATDSRWAWGLLVAGAVLFYGVVLYRMFTATVED